MNKKKLFMIFILLIVILIIIFLLINVIKKSDEKADEVKISDSENVIQITDSFFIEQTNDIYLNIDEYIGKTIVIEGYVYSYLSDNNQKLYAVVRNSPGCCGNDGLAGIDIRMDKEYPSEGKWVEAKGIIQAEDDISNNGKYPAIKVIEINEKEEGQGFVTN